MEDYRGFKTYIPNICMLCEKSLNSLRDNIAIPPFNEFTCKSYSELNNYRGYVHLDCWYLWEYRNVIASKAIEDYQPRFTPSDITKRGKYTIVWKSIKPNSCGGIFLPRSSMIYKEMMGYELSSFNIEGDIKNIEFVLKILTEYDLKPRDIFESTKEYGSKIFIECYDYLNDYFLEVYVHSSKGMDYNCFIFSEDLQAIKNV